MIRSKISSAEHRISASDGFSVIAHLPRFSDWSADLARHPLQLEPSAPPWRRTMSGRASIFPFPALPVSELFDTVALPAAAGAIHGALQDRHLVRHPLLSGCGVRAGLRADVPRREQRIGPLLVRHRRLEGVIDDPPQRGVALVEV